MTHNVRYLQPRAGESGIEMVTFGTDQAMSKSKYPLRLPASVKKAAAELAASDGVSLNQFIAAAVAEKVGCLPTARAFLRERAGSAKPKDMFTYLRRAPKVPPSSRISCNGARRMSWSFRR